MPKYSKFNAINAGVAIFDGTEICVNIMPFSGVLSSLQSGFVFWKGGRVFVAYSERENCSPNDFESPRVITASLLSRAFCVVAARYIENPQCCVS
jgi:hypothetical protein